MLWKPVLRLWAVLAGFRLGSHLGAADVAPYLLYVVSDTLHAVLCCVPILAHSGRACVSSSREGGCRPILQARISLHHMCTRDDLHKAAYTHGRPFGCKVVGVLRGECRRG